MRRLFILLILFFYFVLAISCRSTSIEQQGKQHEDSHGTNESVPEVSFVQPINDIIPDTPIASEDTMFVFIADKTEVPIAIGQAVIHSSLHDDLTTSPSKDSTAELHSYSSGTKEGYDSGETVQDDSASAKTLQVVDKEDSVEMVSIAENETKGDNTKLIIIGILSTVVLALYVYIFIDSSIRRAKKPNEIDTRVLDDSSYESKVSDDGKEEKKPQEQDVVVESSLSESTLVNINKQDDSGVQFCGSQPVVINGIEINNPVFCTASGAFNDDKAFAINLDTLSTTKVKAESLSLLDNHEIVVDTLPYLQSPEASMKMLIALSHFDDLTEFPHHMVYFYHDLLLGVIEHADSDFDVIVRRILKALALNLEYKQRNRYLCLLNLIVLRNSSGISNETKEMIVDYFNSIFLYHYELESPQLYSPIILFASLGLEERIPRWLLILEIMARSDVWKSNEYREDTKISLLLLNYLSLDSTFKDADLNMVINEYYEDAIVTSYSFAEEGCYSFKSIVPKIKQKKVENELKCITEPVRLFWRENKRDINNVFYHIERTDLRQFLNPLLWFCLPASVQKRSGCPFSVAFEAVASLGKVSVSRFEEIFGFSESFHDCFDYIFRQIESYSNIIGKSLTLDLEKKEITVSSRR